MIRTFLLLFVLVFIILTLTKDSHQSEESRKQEVNLRNLFSQPKLQTKRQTQTCSIPINFQDSYPTNLNTKDPRLVEAITKAEEIIKNNLKPSQGDTALSAGIVLDQNVLSAFGIGSMDPTNPQAPSPDENTVYKIASQTKVFTAMMLLMLRDQGAIHLDDPVSEKFPTFSLINNPFVDNDNPITFRHLATQTSGLPRELPCPWDIANSTILQWKCINEYVIPLYQPLIYPSYSNLGFTVLGRALEGIVGQEYETWVEDNMLAPLQMSSSGFEITDAVATKMPSVLIPGTNTPFPKKTDLYFENPAGQMYSSVSDMLKFLSDSFKEDESVISKWSWFESQTPEYINYDGLGGFGFPYEMYYFQDLWFYTKGGDLGGYHSISIWCKELKFGMTILTGSGSGSYPREEVVEEVAGVVVPVLKEMISEAQRAQEPTPEEYELYVGCYVLGDPSNTFCINQTSVMPVRLSLYQDGTSIPISFKNKAGNSYYFQLGMTPQVDCLLGQLLATQGEYLVVTIKGGIPFAMFPGLYGINIEWSFGGK